MRRADRLFSLLELLRGRRRPVTAASLAEALEVSVRTVYRDVADLIASGVPIEGEAGVGYRLGRGFDLPPLMFSEAELEALVLGARVAEAWGDPALARAATSALSRIGLVVPERLRIGMESVKLFAPDFHVPEAATRYLPLVREAVARRRRLAFAYADRSGASTRRSVWPLALFFWGSGWSIGAWCELREDFRSFRVDRLSGPELGAEFPELPTRDLAAFRAAQGPPEARAEVP